VHGARDTCGATVANSANGASAQLTYRVPEQGDEAKSSRPATEMAITDNLEDLLSVLPPRIPRAIKHLIGNSDDLGLIELVLDLGRRPEARF
jgi:hypothetical protein